MFLDSNDWAYGPPSLSCSAVKQVVARLFLSNDFPGMRIEVDVCPAHISQISIEHEHN